MMKFDLRSLQRALLTPSTMPELISKDLPECIINLPLSRTVSPFIDATMRYDEKCCARQALSLFLGESVEEEIPSIESMCSAAEARGKTLRVLYRPTRMPTRYAIYVTARRTPKCQSAATAKAISVRTGARDATTAIANMARSVPGDCTVVIAIVFSRLHPRGHCIVLREIDGRIFIGDPFLPAHSAARVPTIGLAWMILAGAKYILG